MLKATIIGHFGFGLECFDGQTVKTRNLARVLDKIFGENYILKQDTKGSLNSLLKSPIVVWKAFKQSQNIIILPAYRGIRIYAPLLIFYRLFFKNRKSHYVVVGGWLDSFLSSKPFLKKAITEF